MKYMGSKNRHAKEILEIVLKNRRSDQPYIEPFVGGANVIDKVDGLRIGNDNNPYLIALLSAVRDGWIPPNDISEEEYKAAKEGDVLYTDYEIGFIGFCCSYSGKWFGGYARGNDSNGNSRNYCAEQKRNLIKQRNGLIGVDFRHGSYLDLEIPEKSIIYCDPPYANTTKYSSGKFDSLRFWDWCYQKSCEGHTVFVSEYTAPEWVITVWGKEVNNTLTKDTGSKKGIEKLFKVVP